ncbi:MAG: TIGR02221 family CRISPR-associated protein [Desulfobulbus sp.]|nr:TIGR02221 family CRISPR-associated protein [Desulfobulbus sp.]
MVQNKRNVFISFLGTTPYVPCNYRFNNEDTPIAGVRFLQEACIRQWCTDWTAGDRIFICVTDESKQLNWADDGHKDDGEPMKSQGLESTLNSLDLAVPVELVTVPSGKTEEEIWDIFEIIFNLLQKEDNLYFDITHGFRSLPLLAMTVLNYAKAMKNITVRAISYGALEALGKVPEVKKMPLADRNVPVFDLVSFDRLQDWVIGVDRFTASGDTAQISRLANSDIRSILKETKGKHDDAQAIRELSKHLSNFSTALTTCRGLKISDRASSVNKSLEQIKKTNLIRPLEPVLEKIKPLLADFSGDAIADGLAAAQWCYTHNLYQQGYTILNETMITFVVNQFLGTDGTDKQDRELVNQCVNIILAKNESPSSTKDDPARREEIIARMEPQKTLLSELRNLKNIRNDINHAGYNDNPARPETIQKNLLRSIETMRHLVAEITRSQQSEEQVPQ